MVKNAIKLLLFVVLITLNFSCIDDDYTQELEKLKTLNTTYFNNMKDSTDFQLYEILPADGGGMYYYKIITQGNAASASPDLEDLVTVNYKGMLIDGTVFDGTYSGTNPISNTTAVPLEFTVSKLIPGWVFNLLQMKQGEVRTIVLPYYLAYGSYGAGSAIKPYSTLRFDIHLVSIKKTTVE